MTDYKFLVFSGGGIKAISYLGGLRVLEANGGWSKLKGVSATSAGALIGAMVAIGLTCTEIEYYMCKMNSDKIIGGKGGFVKDMYDLYSHYGACSNNYLYKYIGKILLKHCGSPDYTISQLYKDKKVKLIIPVTCVNEMRVIYLQPGHHNPLYSNIPIRLAIKMTTAIPFLFEPISYNGMLFADGGLMDNYPIEVFDGEDRGEVLGMRVIDASDIEIVKFKKIGSLYEYSVNYVEMFMNEANKSDLDPKYMESTIRIITPTFSALDFGMDKGRRDGLISLGREAAVKFFEDLVRE